MLDIIKCTCLFVWECLQTDETKSEIVEAADGVDLDLSGVVTEAEAQQAKQLAQEIVESLVEEAADDEDPVSAINLSWDIQDDYQMTQFGSSIKTF